MGDLAVGFCYRFGRDQVGRDFGEKNLKGWKLVEVDNFVKVYELNGSFRCVYPKAPKWAQEVAVRIWKDMMRGGPPTKKGVKDIVRGQWAKMISEAAR